MATTVMSNKNTRTFVVDQQNGMVFVGTEAYVSTIAAQMIVHEAMKPTGLKFGGKWTNLEDENGNTILGVGYKLSLIDRILGRKMDVVYEALKQYS